MSIYGALFSGVSGLAAQSQALGTIADNVTNVNTNGYKETMSEFSTLVTTARSVSSYSPGGVTALPRALIDRQGLLQASASAMDLSISGNGFFVINTSATPSTTEGSFLYTRAGSFTADSNGDLRNVGGFYLQGWPVDSAGDIPSDAGNLSSLETVNISNLTGTATATTEISLRANLQSSQVAETYSTGDMADGTVTPNFERTIQIFDSLGGLRSLTFAFFKDDSLLPNQWSGEIIADPPGDVTDTDGLLGSGILAFNTDGSLDATNTTMPTTLTITTWLATLGIDDSAIDIDYGSDGLADGITQFDAASILVSADSNGAVFGALSGIEINEDGVSVIKTNGTVERVS